MKKRIRNLSIRKQNQHKSGSRKLQLETLETRRVLDASAPAVLQWFETDYEVMETRLPDVFEAGYGSIWLPPPGRADSGDQSVGYDVYDRFDLGSSDNPTLYGSGDELRSLVELTHRLGGSLYVDAVINHNGFSDSGTENFTAAGGYPGFALTLDNAVDGDFHSAFAGGDIEGRLAGLIDINHRTNHQFVRHPVSTDDAANIPGPAPGYNGPRKANDPDLSNTQFYPDRDLDPIMLFDPSTGETNIAVYPFNSDCNSCGDPVSENATGYLMRYLQWMVQDVGVDGFRIDAAKHVHGEVLDYMDRAVYRANPRSLLDGSIQHVFSFSEAYTGDKQELLNHVKKNINPQDPGRIGGNRDTLDFSTFFALRDNLSSAGTENAWRNIKAASLDDADDGIRNGSAGVLFVQSHDDHGPTDLGNVAYAYMLMQPGNAVVYFNGSQFGDARDFPKPGRGDALGGVYGDALTSLVSIRNTHGRGRHLERWIDDEGIYAFEREASALIGLSNRGDSGFDQRTVQVAMAPGTHLIELSGNSSEQQIDPHDDIPDVLTVSGNGTIDLRIPRANNANGETHGQAYVIYGLPTPQSANGLEILGDAQVLVGSEPEPSDFENGRTRLGDLHVITADSFQTRLLTNEVRLLGSDELRDIYADGDHALLKLDGGIDLNGNGQVDFVDPADVSYGFEAFTDKSSPLIGSNGIDGQRGDGEFLQTINTTTLSEGIHFLEARAFRHRIDDGPAVFSDFKKTVYIDRLPPESVVAGFNPRTEGINENRSLEITSVDGTANSVHVFLDLPSGMTNQSVIEMAQQGQGTTNKTDRTLFQKDFDSVTHGNHAVTVVTFEISGNVNVQRYGGVFADTIFGAGLGDLNFDGEINITDIELFEDLYQNRTNSFNAAADFNGDGLITYKDLVNYSSKLAQINASSDTVSAFSEFHQTQFSAIDDIFNVNVNASLEISSPGVVANDIDPAMESELTVVADTELNGSLGSTAAIFADGRFTYTPNTSLMGLTLGQQRTETFNYQLTDSLGSSSTANIQVVVNGVNAAPTFSSLSDLVISANATTQTIDLRQISSGVGEDQPIKLTAISSDTDLTGELQITLAESNSIGTLQFTPVADAYGAAEIIVSIEDGGLDNNLNTSTDNGLTERSFTLNVIDANALSTNLSGFHLQPARSTGSFIPSDLSEADFDGDGVNDLLVESSTAGAIALWSANDFNQSQPTAVIDNIQQLSRTHVKDFDNDGDQDIIVNSKGEIGLHWYRNQGNWVFEKAVFGQPESIQASYYLPVDFDLDGDIDLLTATAINNGQTTRIDLHKNQDDPETLSFSTLFEVASLAGVPVTGDLDNDGDIDIVLSMPAENTISWFENDGELNFSARDIIPANAATIPSVSSNPSVADLNKDGNLDIIIPADQNDGLSVLMNQGAGQFTAHLKGSDTPSNSLELSDLDSDGDIDLVAVSHAGDEVVWLENDSTGNFVYHLLSNTISNARAITPFSSETEYPNILFGSDDNSGSGTISFLENRKTAADPIDIVIDYRFDTGFFAENPERQYVMELAASTLEAHIKDSLSEIAPENPNTWSINFDNPTTGQSTSLDNVTVPVDSVIIFVGASDIEGLGYGGPGGWAASGTQQWLDTVSTRGQTGINNVASQTTDFAPWGGVVTFASSANWHSNMTPPDPGTNDLYSVAVHEFAHVLGMGISDSWVNLINPSGRFAGPASVAEYGEPIPLYEDNAHWLDGIESQLIDTNAYQETAMDPDLTVGERKLFTKLDLASMEDIGWDVSPSNHLPTLGTIPDQFITNTDSHAILLNNISPGGGEKHSVRLTATTLDPTLIPTLNIDRAPAASTATLHLNVAETITGTTSIVVMTEDAGPDNNFATTFDNRTFRQAFNITVYADGNNTPTLDAISNKTIDEGASAQTVDLAGITAGGGENQPLRVTASSSNDSLMAAPAVSYTSPNTTGSLQFTPLQDQYGVTTITVTVEDGGLDADLSTTADNATFSRTFDVTVRGEFTWHNYTLPVDVNNDGVVSALDALIVINHLNQSGSHELSPTKPSGAMWLDVNKDQWVSPADAIAIINHLNIGLFEVALGIVPLDLSGNQITSLNVGEIFYLSLVTEDLRTDSKGVFAGYADVQYPAANIEIAGVASFLSPYVNGRSWNTESPGLIDEWGAFAGLTETGDGSYIISTIPMKATKAGSIVFGASTSDNHPVHDVLLYGSEDIVDPNSIYYRATELLILEDAEGEGWSEEEDLIDLISANKVIDPSCSDRFFRDY